ncbi:MAG: flagellar export chaperone FliS [Acidithiobacillus sp.]
MQQIPIATSAALNPDVVRFNTDGLILLGLDGVEKYIRQIRRAIEQQDFAAKQRAMDRVQQVVQHLLVMLDEKLPVAHLQRLDSLYRYLLLKLAHVNLFSDLQGIAECKPILSDLRLEWAAILYPFTNDQRDRLKQVDFAQFLLG